MIQLIKSIKIQNSLRYEINRMLNIDTIEKIIVAIKTKNQFLEPHRSYLHIKFRMNISVQEIEWFQFPFKFEKHPVNQNLELLDTTCGGSS